jgi:three-Cys-motif partner protein
MPEPVLWPLEDHTLAKHRVLRSYLDGWIPIMGHQALRAYGSTRRLLLVDGFAGPGRYTGGEPGSPLIMLDALKSHSALPRLGEVKFLYLFVEHNPDRVTHLRSEVKQLDLPSNVQVFIEEGEFETTFGHVVDDITSSGKLLVPTFAFIDPFGYSAASMSLTGRFLSFPRSEALFFLPLSYIHRFVGRSGQDAALTALFETEEWRDAIPLDGDARRSFLIDLFERQLGNQGQVKHVRSFELRTRDSNDYRLVFATGHDKGLQVMKEAMWSVDPLEGTRYVARTQTGQEVLFEPTVDTAPLLSELEHAFGERWFTVQQASEVALVRTPFLPDKHLKRLTLVPAETAGRIEVKRPAGRRAGTFTDDVRMRFTGHTRPDS